MKIAVIAGGLNHERDVSLSSGALIANALIDAGYEVCLVDLYIGVKTECLDTLFIDSSSRRERYDYSVPEHEPNLDQLKKELGNGKCLIGENVINLCKSADLVFLALHGDIGENGKFQAVLDSFGIKYTGTGYIGSLLAMDKDLSKLLMVQNGIPTPEWGLVKNGMTPSCEIDLPCVIKPCSGGSSVGTSIVRSEEEFIQAIKYAGKYEDTIMIEKMIEGREFSVGILDGRALPAIEIIPHQGFFDYKNKYQAGLTQEICPAEISEEIAAEMGNLALKVHEVLRLGSYSRIDFMMDSDNNIFCLEANTLPGMTPTSLLPQEAMAAGVSYEELCERIVRIALL